MKSSRQNLVSHIDIGDMVLTECQMVNQFKGSKTVPPQFTRGYGLVFGFNERKAMAMGLGRSRDARRANWART